MFTLTNSEWLKPVRVSGVLVSGRWQVIYVLAYLLIHTAQIKQLKDSINCELQTGLHCLEYVCKKRITSSFYHSTLIVVTFLVNEVTVRCADVESLFLIVSFGN